MLDNHTLNYDYTGIRCKKHSYATKFHMAMLDCNEYYYYHRTFSCTCLHTILGVNNPTVSLIHLDAITILHTKSKIRLFMVV